MDGMYGWYVWMVCMGDMYVMVWYDMVWYVTVCMYLCMYLCL